MSKAARVSPWPVLFVVCSALFLMPFMLSAVAVALPSIDRSLHAGALQFGLVETVYILFVALFLLPMGRPVFSRGKSRLCYVYTNKVIKNVVSKDLLCYIEQNFMFDFTLLLQH